MRFIVLSIFTIIFLFFIEPNEVSACSGGGFPTVETIFENYDYVVRAQVMETDDLGQNFVLRIEQHYKSEGPEYALVVRNLPIHLSYLDAGMSSGGDCIGRLPAIRPGTILYGVLNRISDGSYRFSQAHRPISSESVSIQISADQEVIVNNSDLEVELDRIFTEASDFIPVTPTSDEYPLNAPLIIYTDGNSYILPIDFGELASLSDVWRTLGGVVINQYPPACFTGQCVNRSPDKLNITSQPNESTIVFVEGEQITGENILFSSTSDAVAVWYQCNLTIYTTGYTIYGHLRYQIEALTQTTILGENDCSDYHLNAVWTPDGRFLTYVDAQGVWIWDVYSDLAPQILLESDSELTLRYFSPLGRYLALNEGDTRYNLDVFTNEQFPDGLISLNDRLLLSYDTAIANSPFEICSLTPFSCDPLGGMYVQTFDENGERIGFADTNTASDVAWMSNSMFLVLTCSPELGNVCSVFRWLPKDASAGWQLPQVMGRGYAFDYDIVSNQLAIVTDVNTIAINGMPLDLSEQVEGDIVSVEWGESFFYAP